MKKPTKTERLKSTAFREVHADEPAIVGHTRAKFGTKRAEAQRTAIALNKARKAGARIPRAEHGGRVCMAGGGYVKMSNY